MSIYCAGTLHTIRTFPPSSPPGPSTNDEAAELPQEPVRGFSADGWKRDLTSVPAMLKGEDHDAHPATSAQSHIESYHPRHRLPVAMPSENVVVIETRPVTQWVEGITHQMRSPSHSRTDKYYRSLSISFTLLCSSGCSPILACHHMRSAAQSLCRPELFDGFSQRHRL